MAGTEAQQGLGELAHTLRRSVALHCSIITSAEGTPDDQVFAKAQEYSDWIRGHASNPPVSAPLGLSLRDVTG